MSAARLVSPGAVGVARREIAGRALEGDDTGIGGQREGDDVVVRPAQAIAADADEDGVARAQIAQEQVEMRLPVVIRHQIVRMAEEGDEPAIGAEGRRVGIARASGRRTEGSGAGLG